MAVFKALVMKIIEDIVICFVIIIQLFTSWSNAMCLGVYSCACESHVEGIVINCRGGNLEQVPVFKNESNQLYIELTLENNQIKEINDRAFANLRLKRLLLSGNPIINIANAAFAGLEADLTELVIELTSEAAFPTAAIQPLDQLQRIEISKYGRPQLPPGAFANLTNLQKLALTSTALQSLNASDFSDQQAQLLSLDLSTNQFREVPTAAINSLKRLSTLKLNQNSISVIRAGSFSNLVQLQSLDLSQNLLETVESNAFSGLEASLQNLTMQLCHLNDQHLASFRQLRSLKLLDIGSNFITNVDGILTNMKSVEVLKLARNKVTSINRSVYRTIANSLRLLELSGNPIAEVSLDAFADLNQLQELYLDGASGLQLNADSFKSQQTSMRHLSLRSTNLSTSQWTAVNNLTQLHTLWMSDCELGNIPDFTFQVANQLENLDLNSNQITNITQRSLTGLENSLIRLYLNKNQITTLDECVFYQFTKIDILRLQLSNNPLRCDCDMKWLHLRVQNLKNNPNSSILANSLRWTCDNLSGRLFNSLTDADFVDCQPTAKVCEELVTKRPTTTTVTTTDRSTVVSVIDATTKNPDKNELAIILGVILGVGIPCVLIFIVIVLFVFKRSQRRKKAVINSPQLGDQTKRFIRPNDLSRSNSQISRRAHSPDPQNASPAVTSGDVIAHAIDAMTELEKLRLVNLLADSRGSMEISLAPLDKNSKNVYEEILDNYYDEIPTDDTV